MKNYQIFYSATAIFLVVISSVFTSECPKISQDETILDKESKTKLFKGQQIFTVDFLDKALKAMPNENLFFSPYSLYRSLLLAYMGSQNNTEQVLSEALNLQWSHNKTEVLIAYKQDKVQRLQNSKIETGLEFESADKYFFDQKVVVKSCMKQLFADEIEVIDIENDPNHAREYINSWVLKQTREQIKDLIAPNSLDASTKLAIANAAYFKGLWSSKFDEASTVKELFYKKPDNITFVEMMKQVGSFNFAANEKLGCHILEIPYNKSNPNSNSISFIVFLPPFVKENALEDVLSKITPETLAQALNEGQTQKVDLKLPKFTMEKTIELVPVLTKMGLGEIFSTQADFTEFSESTQITFSDAIHKAKIEVDENGSRAAAATAMFSFRSSRPIEPIVFHANHPFLFMIYDHKTRAILFAGVYRGPE